MLNHGFLYRVCEADLNAQPCVKCAKGVHLTISDRLVKQKQWELWHAKWKLVSGSKHWERFCGSSGVSPRKIFETVYAKSCNLVAETWFAVPSIMRS